MRGIPVNEKTTICRGCLRVGLLLVPLNGPVGRNLDGQPVPDDVPAAFLHPVGARLVDHLLEDGDQGIFFVDRREAVIRPVRLDHFLRLIGQTAFKGDENKTAVFELDDGNGAQSMVIWPDSVRGR